MINFWLNNFSDLFSFENFNIEKSTNTTEKHYKMLNIVALLSIVIGIVLVYVTKKPFYFGITILILSLTILIKTYIKTEQFTNPDETLSNSFNMGVKLTQDIPNNINKIYVNNALNFNKGDVILIQGIGSSETHIVSDIQYTTEEHLPVLILLNNTKLYFSKNNTQIFKVSDASPNIISPPDGNRSIESAGKGPSDPESINYPSFNLPNGSRYDWNLELSTYGGMEPGEPPTYEYQGQPYGNLKCRKSTVNNPMGTINITEYDATPTMYGTCNVGDLTIHNGNVVNNDYAMTDNLESTVSMRVNDLLFHKGNSQSRFSPVPVDTLPNNQEAFAHFCYTNPTNLINPKYASIFVNNPEAFKLVSGLAKATGTENGGGGGGGGRGP